MSLIQKQAILTQLINTINSLNVSVQTNKDLVLYIKTAINAGLTADTIITELETRIGNVTTTTLLEDIVLLSVAANLISNDRILTVPDLATLQGFTNISTGTLYFVESEDLPYIRKSNGTWVVIDPTKNAVDNLYAWGRNNVGQLGDNSVTNRSSPVVVSGGFTDWAHISTNFEHNLAIRANGTLWAWGNNNRGQLGYNSLTTESKSSPVAVVGGFSDWVTASAGNSHSLAIRANGTLYTWGANTSGQLGQNSLTTSSVSSPILVAGGVTNWISVSAGNSHSIALRANGTIWSWGGNILGQLGQNSLTTSSTSSPIQVAGNFVNCIGISSIANHNIVVRTDGTLWAWGSNNYGQLGDNSVTGKSSPVAVAGGFFDWTQASAGWSHSLGIRANGVLYAWGRNTSGELGNNSIVSTRSPVAVTGGFTDWVVATVGPGSGAFGNSFGIKADGTLYAWGFNLDGNLGNNNTTSTSSPVLVTGGFSDWISVSSGNRHSIAIRSK